MSYGFGWVGRWVEEEEEEEEEGEAVWRKLMAMLRPIGEVGGWVGG